MQFIKVQDEGQAAKRLANRLNHELEKHNQVLWLIPGGSNLAIVNKTIKLLPDQLTAHLVITLTDERYGESGHIYSNAKQLFDIGFTPKQAIFLPVLVPGFSLAETKLRYEETVRRAFEQSQFVIGHFGIGEDGHIAGVLPHTNGVEDKAWVVAYESYEHTRITLTLEAIRHIPVAFVCVFGEKKRPALRRLKDQSVSLADEPALVLKDLAEAYIINDQVGD